MTTTQGVLVVGGLGLAGVGGYVLWRRYQAQKTTTTPPTCPSGYVLVNGQCQPASTGSNTVVVPTSASWAQRLQALQQYSSVQLPGLSSQQVAVLQQYVRQYPQAIVGVSPLGVLALNPSSGQAISVLATVPIPSGSYVFPGVSIPGVSSATMAYLTLLAHQGRLCGISSTGQAALC